MRQARRSLAAGLLAATALSGCCLNLATVDEGRLYRSGQPDAVELEHLIDELGLESVLCLRSGTEADGWYREEASVCARRGVRHATVRLSGYRYPEPAEILMLLDAFEAGPYPMLVHCRGGADRTGLAAAVYRVAVLGHPPGDADDELSLRFGWLGRLSGADELQRFLDLYADTAGGKDLRTWVSEDYPRLLAGLEGGRDAQRP